MAHENVKTHKNPKYHHQEYPKMVYKYNAKDELVSKVIKDADAEATAGREGWGDHPETVAPGEEVEQPALDEEGVIVPPPYESPVLPARPQAGQSVPVRTEPVQGPSRPTPSRPPEPERSETSIPTTPPSSVPASRPSNAGVRVTDDGGQGQTGFQRRTPEEVRKDNLRASAQRGGPNDSTGETFDGTDTQPRQPGLPGQAARPLQRRPSEPGRPVPPKPGKK